MSRYWKKSFTLKDSQNIRILSLFNKYHQATTICEPPYTADSKGPKVEKQVVETPAQEVGGTMGCSGDTRDDRIK